MWLISMFELLHFENSMYRFNTCYNCNRFNNGDSFCGNSRCRDRNGRRTELVVSYNSLYVSRICKNRNCAQPTNYVVECLSCGTCNASLLNPQFRPPRDFKGAISVDEAKRGAQGNQDAQDNQCNSRTFVINFAPVPIVIPAHSVVDEKKGMTEYTARQAIKLPAPFCDACGRGNSLCTRDCESCGATTMANYGGVDNASYDDNKKCFISRNCPSCHLENRPRNVVCNGCGLYLTYQLV